MKQQTGRKASAEEGVPKRKIHPATICCGILLIILIIVLMIFLLRDPEETDSSGRGVLVTPDNVEKLVAEAQKNTDEAYTASMNIEWMFEGGGLVPGNAYVKNTESNSRTVYFDLLLDGTNDVIYSSPYIPVGSTLKDFALEKELDVGDYNAIVQYHLVDENNKEVSTVAVTVKLHIVD